MDTTLQFPEYYKAPASPTKDFYISRGLMLEHSLRHYVFLDDIGHEAIANIEWVVGKWPDPNSKRMAQTTLRIIRDRSQHRPPVIPHSIHHGNPGAGCDLALNMVEACRNTVSAVVCPIPCVCGGICAGGMGVDEGKFLPQILTRHMMNHYKIGDIDVEAGLTGEQYMDTVLGPIIADSTFLDIYDSQFGRSVFRQATARHWQSGKDDAERELRKQEFLQDVRKTVEDWEADEELLTTAGHASGERDVTSRDVGAKWGGVGNYLDNLKWLIEEISKQKGDPKNPFPVRLITEIGPFEESRGSRLADMYGALGAYFVLRRFENHVREVLIENKEITFAMDIKIVMSTVEDSAKGRILVSSFSLYHTNRGLDIAEDRVDGTIIDKNGKEVKNHFKITYKDSYIKTAPEEVVLRHMRREGPLFNDKDLQKIVSLESASREGIRAIYKNWKKKTPEKV